MFIIFMQNPTKSYARTTLRFLTMFGFIYMYVLIRFCSGMIQGSMTCEQKKLYNPPSGSGQADFGPNAFDNLTSFN